MDSFHTSIRSSSWRLRVLCVAAAVAGLSDCSTFDVYDRYELPDGAMPWQASVPGGMVAITFDRDTKFSSAGVLGMPVLPAVAGSSAQGTITLRTSVVIDAQHDFSVARSVCFGQQGGATLCTGPGAAFAQAEVDAFRETSSGLPWRRINLTGPTDFKSRPIPADPSLAMISSRELFQLLGSPFSAQWKKVLVWVVYSVKCNGSCPTTISVTRDSLFALDGSATFTGTQELTLRRVRDYQPTAAVQ